MKTTINKIVKTVCLLSFFLSLSSAFAQAPQKMSYQAVVRNAGNVLVTNATVGMRISVLQGTANGTAVYVETQTPTTNTNGLAALEIGAGTVVSGTFASISWGTNNYYVKTETDPTGGTNYTISGTSQLLSVPYALYAGNAGTSSQWGANGTDIYNNNAGNVGIGLSIPTAKLDVVGKTKTINLQVTSGAGTGKVLTSDASGNASWATPVVPATNSYTKASFGISTPSQGSIIDIATSNVTVPAAGYYLVTYFVNANNNWFLSCSSPCNEAKVLGTRAYLYNKTSGAILQNQKTDFLERDNTHGPQALIATFLYQLPYHEISGSFVSYFNLNDIVGIRVGSDVTGPIASGSITGNGEVTLVRLY
ncbi:hypothetical protein [Flavobacterium amnicola]|uniref:hypothetical protein n=1 Tax=Flavobacterium amnicola TaxID=2506422 RepID=UPI0019D71673|nr:hypothetical protein [Flavobacterium amnicola]